MKFLRCVLSCTAVLVAFSLQGQPYGLSNRVGNTTLRMPPTPPVSGYVTTNAFGNLTFTDPMVVLSPPGETNRLFVVEQRGRIAVITNLTAPNRTVFLDIVPRVTGGVPPNEQGLLGLAFHPNYANNGYFYVYYSTNNAAGNARHQRLARFQVSAANPNAADPNSELPLLTMADDASNHNGGCLQFGPDGYLYLSLGDEGGANDEYNNSQLIDKDFWSGILRLDVDNRPENLEPNPHPAINAGTYRVPADNPFVGVTTWHGVTLVPSKVRTEFYAVGLRNPWRFSFDLETGRLYCADVGQNAREEIDVITKGGNYGWAFREGFIAGPKSAPPGAVAINPILDYGRGSGTNQGTSVTGGVVYRGSKLPALVGSYIFADYVSGNVWATRYDGVTTPSPFVRIASDGGITGFGTDPSNGDVLLCDSSDDTLKRLVNITPPSGNLPATLADTGAFADLATLTPAAGIVAYDVNVPAWSDNASASRWFYVPTNRTVSFRATQNWTYPTGTVWIQHFELELTNGVPASRKRVETRILVRDNASGVYGATYRWGDSTVNATLVGDGGMEETFMIDDGGGNLRSQVWRYPGRSECLLCHTGPSAGGLALGFNTPQLNRNFDYAGIVDNQLRAMQNAGYFLSTAQPSNINSLRFLAPLTNEDVSAEQRVRSYLTANCLHCHSPGGSISGPFDARIHTSLPNTRLIYGVLATIGNHPDNRLVVPGSLERSMLLTRVATRSAGQMPPLGTFVVDTQAVALIERWITNDLASYKTLGQWQLLNFGSTNAPNAIATADPDGDRGRNDQEYLAGTDPNSDASFWAIRIEREGANAAISYDRLANRGIELQWSTNLTNTASWSFLNLFDNRPFFSSTGGVTRLLDPIAETNAPVKFYRARIYEP